MTPPPEASVSGEDGLPPIARAMLGLVAITLNGRPVRSCVSYSVPQGFVRVVAKDEDGRAYIRRTTGGEEVATVRADGVVAVRLLDKIDTMDAIHSASYTT